jgi:hypothetical protein
VYINRAITGAIAANFFGARLILMWEALLGRIPFVKSIYSSVKQVSDTVLSDQGTAFRKGFIPVFESIGRPMQADRFPGRLVSSSQVFRGRFTDIVVVAVDVKLAQLVQHREAFERAGACHRPDR